MGKSQLLLLRQWLLCTLVLKVCLCESVTEKIGTSHTEIEEVLERFADPEYQNDYGYGGGGKSYSYSKSSSYSSSSSGSGGSGGSGSSYGVKNPQILSNYDSGYKSQYDNHGAKSLGSSGYGSRERYSSSNGGGYASNTGYGSNSNYGGGSSSNYGGGGQNVNNYGSNYGSKSGSNYGFGSSVRSTPASHSARVSYASNYGNSYYGGYRTTPRSQTNSYRSSGEVTQFSKRTKTVHEYKSINAANTDTLEALRSSVQSNERRHKVCTQKPKEIMNASVKCTLIGNKCKAKCIENYQFPNGETNANIYCNDGEWAIKDLEWTNTLACEPICMPPCKNNGICIQPGMCACAENFVGPYCEHEKKLCLSRPIVPKNSKLSCSSTSCTIQCATGYRFPDGSSITNMICKSGEWVPSRPELNIVPDCQATCTPRCENGGQCLSYNMCQCPEDFRGKQCQYHVDVCSPKKMNFNGAFNCSGDSEVFRCTLSCPIGIQFSSPVASEYVCEYEKGYYSPAVIPQCEFGENVEVVSLGGSSHSSFKISNQTMSKNRSANRNIKKKKGNNKKKYSDSEEDSSYEQIITKTKIVIKKGRKTGKHSNEQEEEDESGEGYETEYDGGENESQKIRSAGIYSLYMNNDVTVRHLIPKPACCSTWNGNKVKTFDGLLYTRKLYCSHTLVEDIIDGTFCVTLISCPRGSKRPCAHAIEILLLNKKYLIEKRDGNVKLLNEKKEIAIPAQLMGMRVTRLGTNYKIHMELVGLTILWDTDRMVTLEATVGLWNRTAGLCGTLDQRPDNDFMTKDRSIAKLPSTFVDAWQTIRSNDVNSLCDSDNQNDESLELVCPDVVKAKAELVCKKLLRSERFADCYKSLQEESMLQACISDYCYCSYENREECACNGVAVFAKECAFHGIKLSPNWCDMEICPLPCKNGRIYKACGPTFEQSCGSAVEDVIGTNCIERCFCPDGTIQHEGQCIRIDECPCKLRGKVFKPGSQIQKDCNTCKCDKGLWKCSEETCGGRCGAIGDPHYLTFDGKHFDFMGKCSYYLLKMDDFSIEAENVACSGSISEAMNLGPTGIDMPSCTKSVTIKINHDNSIKTIKLKQGRQILIDGFEINKLPLKVFDGLMKIRHASSIMLLVAFRDGLKVWWDGMTRVYIDAPASYRGRTKGLCGTFNANQQDDFLTPEGDVESSVSSFANKWRTKESCEYVNDSANVPHPCQINMESKENAMKLCAKLKEKIFEECHWSVDPEPFYEDCLYDMCACKGDIGSCMCPIFSAYAAECGRQGSVISWRHSINECAVKCPLGQIYEECADKCYRSCADIESTQPCKTKCVEGCRCPNGEALNDKN